MKRLKIISVINLAIIIFLEALPLGIKLKLESTAIFFSTSYHSYFDPFPIIREDIFGPFVCAMLSVIILALTILSFFFKKQRKGFYLTLSVLSWIAFAFSLMPLLFSAYTTIGGIISALMLLNAEINLVIRSGIK